MQEKMKEENLALQANVSYYKKSVFIQERYGRVVLKEC